MNIALWIAQGLVALAFLYGGAIKVFTYGYYVTSITKLGQTPVARGLAGFIGIAEMIGAIGVVLPMALNVAPVLSAWAAIGIGIIMLLAMGYHLRGREPALAPIILFLLAAFVAVGRFSHLT
ncbi:MAG TPA: DoxX family protein [Candidatus Binatia bacterium]|nr:DoxX family protein [Candidatus Binatia bacterium]